MRRHCSRKGLEIRIPDKPVKSPFQVAKGVLESFSPVLLFVETLGDGIVFYFIIINPADISLD